MKYIHLIFIILSLCFITSVSAETIIYDNVTAMDTKFFIIEDDVNIKYLNSYKYEVLADNFSIGSFSKGEKIFYENNTNISIIIPSSNINTDITTIWDVGKTQFYIAIMYTGGFLVFIIFIYIIIRKKRY